MQIQDLKINGVKNPVGFCLEEIICSWKVTDTKSKKQKNARIEVSGDETFSEILYTKEGADLRQQGEKLAVDLKPRTTYYYQVAVTGDQGTLRSAPPGFLRPGKCRRNGRHSGSRRRRRMRSIR